MIYALNLGQLQETKSIVACIASAGTQQMPKKWMHLQKMYKNIFFGQKKQNVNNLWFIKTYSFVVNNTGQVKQVYLWCPDSSVNKFIFLREFSEYITQYCDGYCQKI